MAKVKYITATEIGNHNGRRFSFVGLSQEALSNLYKAGCPGISVETEAPKAPKPKADTESPKS